MLSYNQWKMLNENFGSTLGLAVPTNLGMASNPFGVGLDEAKKKAKKKMFGDEDETGDGEMVEPASEKDAPEEEGGCEGEKFCGKMAKKTMKKAKKMSADEEVPVDDEEVSAEEPTDKCGKAPAPEEEGEEAPLFAKKKSKKKMKSEAYLDNDEEWWASIHSMTASGDLIKKHDDGFSKYHEDEEKEEEPKVEEPTEDAEFEAWRKLNGY